ncbi:MAG: flagellar motor switch protein FliM, partial [Thermodesulfobacteriota bacterium]|nr:flagellar motor switch protein FliM [Thermodesulfobacteriota bacterium]
QDRIIRGKMGALDIVYDRFARNFRSSLGTTLQKLIDVSITSINTVKFSEFLRTLPIPTSLNIFRLEPLRGMGILAMDAQLVFFLTDVLFGGTGQEAIKVEGRDFTNIELNIIRKVVNDAFKELEKSWQPVYPLNFQFVRTELNPQFVGIASTAESVVVVNIEVEMERPFGTIKICIPYSILEPIRSNLQIGMQTAQLEADSRWLSHLKERFLEIPVKVIAELGRVQIDVRNLLDLAIGDIIQLNTNVSDELPVKVENVLKFRGYPGVSRGNKAVQISSDISKRGGRAHV